MKKRILLAALIALAPAAVAMATPLPLPSGPIYIKFNNVEQISASNGIVTPDGHRVDNWGLVNVTDVGLGDHSGQEFGLEATYWSNVLPGQITGIFNGATTTPGPGGTITSTGGSIYLFWNDTKTLGGPTHTALPTTLSSIATNWVHDFEYLGVADSSMTLLAKIDFLNGGILPGFPNVSITGSIVPSGLSGGITGVADSYATVDTSVVGAWTEALDSNFFNTALGPKTADLRFKNSYNRMTSWDKPGTDIIGARSDDPARAYVTSVPEPATLSLLGLGLFAAAVISKRRRA